MVTHAGYAKNSGRKILPTNDVSLNSNRVNNISNIARTKIIQNVMMNVFLPECTGKRDL